MSLILIVKIKAGYYEFFGNGWCRDSAGRMYDYLRFYMEGVTPQVCQDRCIQHFSGLTGISTYSSYYCYCWYDNNSIPDPQPSDIHGYSSSYFGTGAVSLTLNEADSDCYKFFEMVINTETPTLMPTEPPTPPPTSKPTALPTQKPTSSVSNVGVISKIQS